MVYLPNKLMKKLIRKILTEQDWKSNEEIPIPEKVLFKIWKFLDRVGLKKGIPLLYIDNSIQESQVILSYYKDYDGKWSEDLPVKISSSEISKLFNDRDYSLEKIVEDYLDGNDDYRDNYLCYDYDHNWMWDDLNDENQKFIIEKAKESGIDMEDDDAVEEFIEDTYGSDISCAFADAQNSADIVYLHSDIMSEVKSVLSEFNGEWDFDKGVFVGTIPFINLVNSDYFEDALRDNLDWGVFDIDIVRNYIINKEMEDLLYGNTGSVFPYAPNINTDRHFRYGGAGDIDESYLNEIISDRIKYI